MRLTFDRFVLDVGRRALLEDGKPLHLSPKGFALLELLLREAPRALSQQEIVDAVWPDTFVETGSLASLIKEVRSLLGDSRREPKYIRTVHGFGYAMCCPVAQTEGPRRAGTLVFNGEEIPLYEGVNVLGRDPSAGVMIDHETVSRRHASITIAPDSVTLEDLQSKNGTFIDGHRLTGAVPLPSGTTFVLGDARVTFRRSGAIGSTVTVARPG